jgi:hypothetical protein
MKEEEKQEEAVVQPGMEVPVGTDDDGKLVDADDVEAEKETPVVNNGEADESEESDGKKKQTIMKVAADAPWKDRMWEVSCWHFCAETVGALLQITVMVHHISFLSFCCRLSGVYYILAAWIRGIRWSTSSCCDSSRSFGRAERLAG